MATEGTPSQVTRYTIIPEDGRNTTAVEEYEGILFSLVEKKLVYTSKCDELGVVFWWTKLSPQQAKELEHPFVTIDAAENNPGSFDRRRPTEPEFRNSSFPSGKTKRADDPFIVQRDATEDMKVASQPPGWELEDLETYIRLRSTEDDVTLYHVDSGFYPEASLEEFPRGPFYRWLYAEPSEEPNFETKDDYDGHGTLMLSKIVGTKYGLVQGLDIVIVKAEITNDDPWPIAIDALTKILQDISPRQSGKCVISMAWSIPPTSSRRRRNLLKQILEALIDKNVVLVTSSGNRGQEVSRYPAKFGKDLKELMVVGAVNTDGKRWKSSGYADYVVVHAPGVQVEVMGMDGDSWPEDGTSIAAASVAAIIAYLLASDPKYAGLIADGTAARTVVEDQTLSYSHARIHGGPKVYYNNVGNYQSPCE